MQTNPVVHLVCICGALVSFAAGRLRRPLSRAARS